jgi:hypothetical protein
LLFAKFGTLDNGKPNWDHHAKELKDVVLYVNSVDGARFWNPDSPSSAKKEEATNA